MSQDGQAVALWNYRIERRGENGHFFTLVSTWVAPSGETISRGSPITLEQIDALGIQARSL